VEIVKVLLKDVSANKQASIVATWKFDKKSGEGESIDLQPYTASLCVQVSGLLDPEAELIFEGTIDDQTWVPIDPIKGSSGPQTGKICTYPSGVRKIRPVLLLKAGDDASSVIVTLFGRGI